MFWQPAMLPSFPPRPDSVPPMALPIPSSAARRWVPTDPRAVDAARETDIVARLGGDEFSLLLPETDAKGAAIVLERVRANVALILAEERTPVTASIGAITSNLGRQDIAALLKLADRQLYASKGSGKNRVTAAVLEE